jgi:hypothetical protein
MDAPGKGILKVVSILFIIFGAIATVISLVGVLGSAALTAAGGGFSFAVGGILMAATVILLIVSVLELILGIVGLRKSGDPEKAGYFITTGIVLTILSLIPMIINISYGGFSVTSLISFVLPILYIVGGAMNKRAVRQ